MWRVCRRQPPILGCSACGSVLRGKKRKKKCVYVLYAYVYVLRVCSLEHFCCQVSAVPICSSHGASWTRSAINQTPAMAECLQTHTHTRSVMSSHKPPITLGSEETKATHDFIKGYSCCVRGHRAKRIFSPKIQHRQQVMLLRHFLSFSACHTLLTAIWRT